MSQNNQRKTEQYAEWLYRNRWFVIVGTVVIMILIGIGMKNLKMNTSFRVWFNEGSDRVKEYDAFRKRFAQDDALIIAFDNEKGIFNNDTIAVIQRLTDKFWKTKYITRADSLTNYSHTYVNGDDMSVKDLFEPKIPTPQEIKAVFSKYINQTIPVVNPSGETIHFIPSAPSQSDILKRRRNLFSDIISSILPYSKEKLNKLMQKSLSKKDMLDLIAETLRVRLPLNKYELRTFFQTYITQDEKVINNLIDQFYPTVKEIKLFLIDKGINEKKADSLAHTIFKTRANLNELLTPHLKQTGFSRSTMELLAWVLPHLSRRLASEQIVGELRHFLDKLPPNKKELIKLMIPYVKEGNPTDMFVEALQVVFSPDYSKKGIYYSREEIKEWLTSPNLTQDKLLDLTSEILVLKLPLTGKELTDFVKRYSTAKNSKSLLAELKEKLFYTDKELGEKKRIALSEKLVKDLFISSDAKTAQILITPRLSDNDQKKTMDFLARVKEILKNEEKRSGNQYKFHVAGLPEMAAAFGIYIEKDLRLMLPIMYGLVLLVMLILFRSIWGMFTPVMVVIFSIIGTLGITGFIGYELNNITSMIPNILMAVGIADSVHILTIFFRELHHGKSKKESMIISMKMNLLPCFLTSITTSLGFLSLLTSISPPIRVLGVIVAIGSIIAFVVTVTLLPALLSVLPFSKKGTHHRERTMKWTIGLGHFTTTYRTHILISLTLVTIIFISFITLIHVDNNPVNYFKKGTYFRDAMDYVDERMKGANIIEVSIDSKKADGIKEPQFLKNIEAFQNYLEKTSALRVSHTNSLVDIVKTVNMRLNGNKEEFYKIPDDKKVLAENLFLYTQSVPYGRDLNNQINVDQSAIRLTVRRPTTSSEENLKVIHAMQSYINKNMKEYDIHITGRAAIFSYTTPKVTSSMVWGIIYALIAITIILAITFKSIKVGLLSIIPNAVPLLLMFGLVGITATDFNMGLSMVAIIALGIVVDDTVHFIAKYLKAKRSGKSVVESVYQVFHDVGSAIIFTSVILTIGFGIMIFSNFLFNVKFGIFTAFTMLAALIMDLLLLPAILLLRVKKKDIHLSKAVIEKIFANNNND